MKLPLLLLMWTVLAVAKMANGLSPEDFPTKSSQYVEPSDADSVLRAHVLEAFRAVDDGDGRVFVGALSQRHKDELLPLLLQVPRYCSKKLLFLLISDVVVVVQIKQRMPSEKAEQVAESSMADMAMRMAKNLSLDGKYLTLSELVANIRKYKEDFQRFYGGFDLSEEERRRGGCLQISVSLCLFF